MCFSPEQAGGIQIIRDHMLAEHKAVAEPLYGYIAQNIVVVLVAGGDQPRRMAGIVLQHLFLHRIADVLPAVARILPFGGAVLCAAAKPPFFPAKNSFTFLLICVIMLKSICILRAMPAEAFAIAVLGGKNHAKN